MTRTALTPLDERTLIAKLERDLMVGRGRWIADFTESFRDHQVNDVIFDAFVRGNTRSSGFLISRLYSFFLNPNYEVACYLLGVGSDKKIDQKTVRKTILAVKDSMRTNETKWAWLYLLGGSIDPAAAEAVRGFLDQTVGMVCVGTTMREVINNDTFLGRQARKYMKV